MTVFDSKWPVGLERTVCVCVCVEGGTISSCLCGRVSVSLWFLDDRKAWMKKTALIFLSLSWDYLD